MNSGSSYFFIQALASLPCPKGGVNTLFRCRQFERNNPVSEKQCHRIQKNNLLIFNNKNIDINQFIKKRNIFNTPAAACLLACLFFSLESPTLQPSGPMAALGQGWEKPLFLRP
ncbi:hypothetical protein ACFO3A_05195 [Comamonas nitrativorans]|uniref:Uncharacterized protein n=1 Tax=Comamonas nitrativorans TaxID=108437 RepID=A0ABV9GY53_9BURK